MIDFQASWCAPCQGVFAADGEDGRAVCRPGRCLLDLDTWNATPAFKDWVIAHSQLREITFATNLSKRGWEIAHGYGVNRIPWQYVIDRNGRIAACPTNEDEANLPQILRKMITSSK